MDAILTSGTDAKSAARPEQGRAGEVVCTADVAECTCPDFCERDHGNE